MATSAKTICAAAVIIPPNEVWRPIQALRARYDRHFARWMPHMTLAFPFRPKEEFDSLAPQLEEACAEIAPFEIELAEVSYFDHGRESFTLWLDPKPAEPVTALHAALMRVTPDCNDIALFAAGFTPHLSVGQARGEMIMSRLRESLQSSWKPLRFQVSELCLVWRGEAPPDDAFRVGRTIQLGRRATA